MQCAGKLRSAADVSFWIAHSCRATNVAPGSNQDLAIITSISNFKRRFHAIANLVIRKSLVH